MTNSNISATKVEGRCSDGHAKCSATKDSYYRTRAGSCSDEESPLLTNLRRGSVPITSEFNSKAQRSTPSPSHNSRMERFKTPSPPSNEELPYDATTETTLRFAQARLASPRSSRNGITQIPSAPRIKVSDPDDPFIDSPGAGWSYTVSVPSSSIISKSGLKQDKGEEKEVKKKRLSTAEMRDKIAAESEERMRCMRKFI